MARGSWREGERKKGWDREDGWGRERAPEKKKEHPRAGRELSGSFQRAGRELSESFQRAVISTPDA